MRTRNHSRLAIILALLVVLLGSPTTSGFTGTSAFAAKTGTSSQSDLLQYEWPQLQGDPAYARFSAGPAPDTPDILWKVNITGVQSYVSAFNGKVFVATRTAVLALDRSTGSIVWNTTVPAPGRWPAVYKIDGTHLVVGNHSLDIDSGQILWTSPKFSANTANFANGVYSPEEKMFFVKTQSRVQGWDFSNPSVPPTMVWETYVSGSASVGSGVQYGDGKVFPGTFEHHQMALDAKTGDVLWDVETKGGMTFAGTYYEGMLFRGSSAENTFYCFNATTGEVLWNFNPGTQNGYWCSGTAAAYGMVYALNKDGFLYAMDAETGEVAWKYKGPGPLFFPGNPVVADGKVYATTGQNASYDPEKGGYSHSEFAALDAYTGHPLWTLATEAFPPRESIAIAYGNLYLVPGFIRELQMDDYYIPNQVWAVGGTQDWPMWRHDPAHSGVGQSGPTNLTLWWKFTANGAIVSSPSAADGRIYFGSEDKKVYSIDAWTGKLLWKFNTSGRILSSPAVVNGKVFIGPDDGNVYCLDAVNGSLLWSAYAGGYIQAHFASVVVLRSSPTVVGGKVYVGSLDKNLYCLDADDGNVDWTFKTNGSITTSPAVVDGVVYFLSQEPSNGGLYEIDAANGNLIRRIPIPYQELSRGTDLFSSPSVAGGMIFVASNKKNYYGINATTGNITWTYSGLEGGEFIIASPVYLDGKVFLVDQFFIVAVNATNGKRLWGTFLSELYVSTTYADDKLYVTSDQRGIYVLNATDGAKIGWFGTDSNSWSSATLYGGRAYLGCNDWNVYCLGAYPRLEGNVTVDLSKSKIILGESATGSGWLVPGKSDAQITLQFSNPNGAVDDVQVVTTKKGGYSFAYSPDIVGNWTVTATWDSDMNYWNSARSAQVNLEVVAPEPPPDNNNDKLTGISVEYVVALALVVVTSVLIIAVFVLKKKRRK